METSNEFVPSLKLSPIDQRWENVFREAIIGNEGHFHQRISRHEASFGLEMAAKREVGFEIEFLPIIITEEDGFGRAQRARRN